MDVIVLAPSSSWSLVYQEINSVSVDVQLLCAFDLDWSIRRPRTATQLHKTVDVHITTIRQSLDLVRSYPGPFPSPTMLVSTKRFQEGVQVDTLHPNRFSLVGRPMAAGIGPESRSRKAEQYLELEGMHASNCTRKRAIKSLFWSLQLAKLLHHTNICR
jgi:hypothetical protein